MMLFPVMYDHASISGGAARIIFACARARRGMLGLGSRRIARMVAGRIFLCVCVQVPCLSAFTKIEI